ncbi:MerR family transcriptional regulator [Micromonospora tulbaghiae]|uniref:MerR family transcriptional regulator n=1 Tax=Micromonospora tulbaghiae TaxID=479978 RepID=UPI003EBFAF54
MDGAERYSIGDLARRTGLPVKTIRFWSDRGIVPPTDRGPAGHRRYDAAAVARLDLVRTLRELGVDLPTVRRVVTREVTLPEVASAHADALTAQIRLLRSRRAVLTVIARRGATASEADLLHRLAGLAARERRRLVDEFLDAAFGGLTDPGFAGIRRSLTPELPDDPDDAQTEAWVELAELALDPGFRAGLRRLAEQHAADRGGAEGVRRDVVAVVREEVAPALAAVSSRPRPRPTRSWTGRRAGTRGSAAGRTTPACAGGCWTGCGPHATLAGSGTWSCSPWSTAGHRPRAWPRCWTGRSGHCTPGST